MCINFREIRIDETNLDMTEYSVFIKNVMGINKEKIKFVAKISNVSFIIAKQVLEEVCILKATAPKVKETIDNLQELRIDYNVSPIFDY